MATVATIGHGTLFKVGTAGQTAHTVMTTVAEVLRVSASTRREAVDVTNMDSANHASEFISGKRSGTIDVELNFTGTNTTMTTLFKTNGIESSSKQSFAIVYSGNTDVVWRCGGWVTDFTANAEDGSQIQASASIAVDAAWVV